MKRVLVCLAIASGFAVNGTAFADTCAPGTYNICIAPAGSVDGTRIDDRAVFGTSGGLGEVWNNTELLTTIGAVAGSMVIDVGSFLMGGAAPTSSTPPVSTATGINSTWELYATVSFGNGPGTLMTNNDPYYADGVGVTVNLYAVNGTGVTFQDPTYNNPASGVVGCASSLPSSTDAASDQCLLIGSGSGTGNIVIASTNGDTWYEEFGFSAAIIPAADASTFLPDPGVNSIDLTVDTGGVEGVEGFMARPVGDDPLDFTTSCPAGHYNSSTDCDVNWSADVPEPATLSLFGAALLGLGALKRRRTRRA